ncbi:pilus assembly protein [Neisseria sp.]|uniref:pilus assembly protein n=1 Tax=Neisseria sp. TaxID=192066 RepID=UPI0026DD31BA|nr:PilC/PilY family type IV pilus protein [Neisseria sp.]MDO4907768.1 PilC/PilY family type IV pilus protein [Neisseria sp.]
MRQKRGGGAYFNANSSTQLQDALNQISKDIAVAAADFAGVTPTASVSSGGKIESAETLSMNTEQWSSQLRFYEVAENGSIDPTKYKLPTYNPSTAVTVISTENGPRILSEKSSGLSNDTFGLNGDDAGQWKKLVRWLTRQGSADDASGDYRVREHNDTQNKNRYLGDVLGGSLTAMGIYNKNGYGYGDSAREYLAVGSNDGMVHIFKKHGKEGHEYTDVFQYIPGLAKRSGTETVNTALQTTAGKGYGGSTHVNLVNGPAGWYETYAGNNRSRLFMTGVLGEGGRAAYALNIAGQNNGGTAIGLDKADNLWLPNSGSGIGTPGQADYFGVPLWDTSSPKIGSAHEIDSRIGHMFGEPMNGRLARAGSKAAKESEYKTENDLFYATVLGSGFNPPASADEKGNSSYPAPSVYVLDSLGLDAGLSGKSNQVNPNSAPGKVVKHISTAGLANNIKTTAPRGMTAVTGLDIDDDGVFDVAYAGDQNGNLYRFDFRGDVSKWNAEILFKGSEARPITAAPEVFRNSNTGRVTVLFGTGSELYTSDLHDKTVQRLYGIQDPLTDDAEKEGDLSTANTGYPLTEESVQLKERTFSEANNARTLTSQGGLESSHLGWYMELDPQNGERVVDKPGIGGSRRRGATVIFSTTVFNPASQEVQNSCTAEGETQTSGFIMTLDAETGGRPVALRFLKDNMDHIGEYKSGNLSTVKLQQNGVARNIFGGSRSGRDLKPGLSALRDPSGCEAVYGSSETGVGVQSFYCPKTAIQRISWREIF